MSIMKNLSKENFSVICGVLAAILLVFAVANTFFILAGGAFGVKNAFLAVVLPSVLSAVDGGFSIYFHVLGKRSYR